MTTTAAPPARDLSTAFAAAYEAHRSGVRAYVWKATGNDAVADDLTSETFLKAWQHYPTFDGRNVKAWLYRIARNLIIDHYRRQAWDSLDRVLPGGTTYRDALADSTADLDRLVDVWDRTAQVQRAARPGDLALVLAHYADGKPHASVNERLRLFRFRKRLRATSEEGQRR